MIYFIRLPKNPPPAAAAYSAEPCGMYVNVDDVLTYLRQSISDAQSLDLPAGRAIEMLADNLQTAAVEADVCITVRGWPE